MRKLARAAFQTASGVAFSAVFRGLGTKIMAVCLGPTGVGVYSLLLQTYQSAVLAGSLQGSTALVQGTATNVGRDRATFVRTALKLIGASSLTVAVGILLLGPAFSGWVTGQSRIDLSLAFRMIGAASCLGVLSGVITAILTGVGAIGSRTTVQLLNWVTIAVLAYPAALSVRQWGTFTPLVLLLAAGAVAASAFGARRLYKLGVLGELRDKSQSFHRPAARQFVTLSASILVGDLTGAVALLIVRSLVMHRNGLQAAGVFDAAWTISIGYTALLHPVLFAYFLPALSRANEQRQRTDLMRSMLRIAILLLVPTITTVVVLKPLLLHGLYTVQFSPALMLVRWFVIADYVKLTGWILATPMLAHARTRAFVCFESAANLTMCTLVVMSSNSLEHIGPALLLSDLIYVGAVLIYALRTRDVELDYRTFLSWSTGLVVICGASMVTWEDHQVNWRVSALCVGIGILISWSLLSRADKAEVREGLLARLPPRD